MQDKTIDNALLALRKQGGIQGKLADVLLDMRGVKPPAYYQDSPLRRGETKRIVLAALRDGPRTYTQLGEAMRQVRPDLTQRAAANRSYQALLRLKDKGLGRCGLVRIDNYRDCAASMGCLEYFSELGLVLSDNVLYYYALRSEARTRTQQAFNARILREPGSLVIFPH
ncbi:hypothetical protein DDZ14_13105 [Maritimibacter sp. 55A14]|uniref:hypothetical protein n=1 Tax=Maritimibacter sp. 55A14 TaxID=2174844 RepID=UPI000D615BE1|nr:hypothetical protein [Maritimibacter sp. 55A14]PWE31294.1 hypothetical protein DDZ14_13105 [Maritimibacter sp. 55A14]